MPGKPKKPEIHVEFAGSRIPRREFEALSERQKLIGRLPGLLEPLTVLVVLTALLVIALGGL